VKFGLPLPLFLLGSAIASILLVKYRSSYYRVYALLLRERVSYKLKEEVIPHLSLRQAVVLEEHENFLGEAFGPVSFSCLLAHSFAAYFYICMRTPSNAHY
jgi:hypothetical protein